MRHSSEQLRVLSASRLTAGLFSIVLLQACETIVPVTELSPAHPAGRIQVTTGETFEPHRLVQQLTTESCLEPPHDALQAKQEMMRKAVLIDADAIVRYQCRSTSRYSIPGGRYQCRTCTGDAISWF